MASQRERLLDLEKAYKADRALRVLWKEHLRPDIVYLLNRLGPDTSIPVVTLSRDGEEGEIRFTLLGRPAFLGYRYDLKRPQVVFGAIVESSNGERRLPLASVELSRDGRLFDVEGSESVEMEDWLLALLLEGMDGLSKAHFDANCPLPERTQ